MDCGNNSTLPFCHSYHFQFKYEKTSQTNSIIYFGLSRSPLHISSYQLRPCGKTCGQLIYIIRLPKLEFTSNASQISRKDLRIATSPYQIVEHSSTLTKQQIQLNAQYKHLSYKQRSILGMINKRDSVINNNHHIIKQPLSNNYFISDYKKVLLF